MSQGGGRSSSALNRPVSPTATGYKGSLASPKIPVVCEALGVRCLTTVEFIQEQGWRF